MVVDGNQLPNYRYRMGYDRPHGIAVIINNINFPGEGQRGGTMIDEQNLSETFRFLGYDVEIHRDCQKRQTESIFQDIAKRDEVTHHDSFVCCILSHGRDGKIISVDDKTVELTYLAEELKDCDRLRGKPKMFFIQACRGGVRDGRVDEGEIEAIEVPSEADFFFGYATTAGYVAWRSNGQDGSYYIKVLCETFCKYAKKTNLVAMHIIINHDVSQHTIEAKEKGKVVKYREIPEFQNRLRAFVYFF